MYERMFFDNEYKHLYSMELRLMEIKLISDQRTGRKLLCFKEIVRAGYA